MEARRADVPTVGKVPGGHDVQVVDDGLTRSWGLDLVRPGRTWEQYECNGPNWHGFPEPRVSIGDPCPRRPECGRPDASSRRTRADGMLTAVLDRLTSLTSKAFIIGAFVPVLAFAFLNGVVLYLEFGWFRAWAEPQLSVAARAFDVVATLIGLAVVAYVLSSLSAFLQQVLEGQHLWHGSRLADRLRQGQVRSYLKLRGQYREARDAAVRTAMARPDRRRPRWPGCAGTSGRPSRWPSPSWRTPSQLSAALSGNDVTSGSRALSEDRLDLLMLFDYADDEWAERELALADRLRARFGTGAVAATAFGNAGRSVQSYAVSRYRLDLASFWSRLQPLVQKHREFYGGLQDAKVQLDFLVACLFQSAFSTVAWLVVLPIWAGWGWLLLAVAVLGLLLIRLFYLAATENYVAFGELVRSSVDLYRFDLVDALRVPRPRSLRREPQP